MKQPKLKTLEAGLRKLENEISDIAEINDIQSQEIQTSRFLPKILGGWE